MWLNADDKTQQAAKSELCKLELYRQASDSTGIVAALGFSIQGD